MGNKQIEQIMAGMKGIIHRKFKLRIELKVAKMLIRHSLTLKQLLKS